MRIPFRQGIVSYQTDNNLPNPIPTFLQRSNSGSSIDLIASPDPTILVFSHGEDHDYSFEESQTVTEAWSGFSAGTDYWLYWDIDTNNASRTFGYTTIEPTSSLQLPASVSEDTHWFDLTNKVMKVYTNGFFIERLRVFAAKYTGGAVIEPYLLGTQVGLNVQSTPGSILFDESGDPIRQGKNRRVGKFVHSETNFSTHASSGSIIKLEAEVEIATAANNIAAYQLVSYRNFQSIGFASSDDEENVVGLSREALFVGETGTFVSKGHVTNPFWNWTDTAGTLLFCDSTGQITVDAPQVGSLQTIGSITSPTSILVDIGQQYVLED